MAPKPNYYHELNSVAALLTQRVAQVEELSDEFRKEIRNLQRDAQVASSKFDELARRTERLEARMEKWETRIWGVSAAVILSLLSAIVGLAVTLWKK